MSPDRKVRQLRRPAGAAPSSGRRLRTDWPAKITGDGKTVECAVLDVSGSGAKIRVEHLPEGLSELSLVLDARDTLPATIVWQRRNQIGLSFPEEQEWVYEISKQRFDPAAWLRTR